MPIQSEMALPKGAPGPLCLYAVFCPRQLNTLIYLCNAGSDPLPAVRITSTTIEMATFFREEGDDRWSDAQSSERCWDLLPISQCIKINQLSHTFWDYVTRYKLTYVDASGQRWQTETHDCNLCVCDKPESERAWVEFRPLASAGATNPCGPERS